MDITVSELIDILQTLPPTLKVRIGDQLEAGPYEHYPVGGIWAGRKDAVILVASPDEESAMEDGLKALPVLWQPPVNREI